MKYEMNKGSNYSIRKNKYDLVLHYIAIIVWTYDMTDVICMVW